MFQQRPNVTQHTHKIATTIKPNASASQQTQKLYPRTLATSPTMSLTGNLLFATGVLHNVFAFMVPELAAPFWRIVADGGLVATTDIQEHYAREAAFWFHFAGYAMMMQGYYIRYTASLMRKHRNKQLDNAIEEEAPTWVGCALTTIGSVGVYCMPVSGFYLMLAQGLRVLWIQYSHNGSMGVKKL
jgi:Family of unknown function (DUF6463)